MTYERDEYRRVLSELNAKAKAGANGARREQLAMLAQAEVSARLLTGSPEWDIFLQMLQATVDRFKANRDSLDEMLKDPRLANADDIIRTKIQYIQADTYVRALEGVVSLPVDIIESGDRARDLLSRLDGDETTEGTA